MPSKSLGKTKFSMASCFLENMYRIRFYRSLSGGVVVGGMSDAGAGSGTVSDDELADQFSDPWGSPRHIHGPPPTSINNIKTGDIHTDDEDDDPPPGTK